MRRRKETDTGGRTIKIPCIAATLIPLLACGTAPVETHVDALPHDDWAAVLARFVDERGRVDYAGLAADPTRLDRYVDAVGRVDPENAPELFPAREDALAYYINAYNALVFRGVLDRGPERVSVWSGLISGYDFFAKTKFKVGGASISLRTLENKIIRKRFEDPRIHAALNCASVGCPRLPRVAFDPQRLDEQLDAAMTEFVEDPRHCQVDVKKGEVRLSKIFDWFREDFLAEERRRGSKEPSLIDYVNRYRKDAEPVPSSYAIRFLEYDKGINKQ